MSKALKFRLCDGFFNERRLGRKMLLDMARMSGMRIVNIPPNHAEEEIIDEEHGVIWYDEIGDFNTKWFMPYPHYAFPRALPIKLKGIAV